MKISIFMMCRDEENIIRQWLQYHGDIFGYANIYVYDNGSTDNTISIINEFIEKGINIDLSKVGRDSFDHKGNIFEGIIKNLDEINPSDFYFPIDCDEFICVKLDSGKFSSSRKDIFNYLETLKETPEVLMIGGGIDNNPYRPGFFRISPHQRKCFFSKDNCDYLDHGFHVARSKKTSGRIKTEIYYYHFHFRPYEIMIAASINKLGDSFKQKTKEEISEYINSEKPGFHVAGNLLMTEDEYKSTSMGENYVHIPEIENYFREKKILYPFSNYALSQSELNSIESRFISSWAMGFVDQSHNTKTAIIISGWCLTQSLKVPFSFSVTIGGMEINNFLLKKTYRPDVVLEYPGADEMCGFQIEIPLDYLNKNKIQGLINISPIEEKIYLRNVEGLGFYPLIS